MPNLTPGTLFGQRRYLVKGCLDRGLYYHHEGEVLFDHLPARHAHDRMAVVYRTINYDTFAPEFKETFPAFVARRRAELRREAEFLAAYHGLTAHAPQVIDLLQGVNAWDPALRAHSLIDDEPCLVLEHLPARSLSRIGHDVSPEEALTFAEKLLSVIRVFHNGNRREVPKRYFGTLTPADVLIDRTTSDCWFHNLGKLHSTDELAAARRLLCERDAHAFVSPALAGWLFPRVKAPAVPSSNPAAADLYSVGVILYWMLAGLPDLSTQPLGWFTPAEADKLKKERGVPAPVADFLAGLAAHRYTSAEEALEKLCAARGIPAPLQYVPPVPPAVKSFPGAVLAPGTVLGGRYEVTTILTAGAMGSVFLGRDTRTGALVVMKIARYENDDLGSVRTEKELLDKVARRRDEMIEEALLVLRAHHRIQSVPQLLDVVLARSPDPILARHANAELSGEREPVLVLEFIPGNSLMNVLDERPFANEDQLLRMLANVCAILAPLHREDDHTAYLYMDWKPDNLMYHPETGNLTLVDMGGVTTLVGGIRQNAELFFTDFYAAPEEVTASTPNRQPKPTFDIHGLAAVFWRLAVRPDVTEVIRLNNLIQQKRTAYPLLDARLLPPGWDRLREIVEKGLLPDPAQRFQSADEMRAAAIRALGKQSLAPPAGVTALTAAPRPGPALNVACTLPADPYATEVVLCRDHTPPADPYSATPWQREAIDDRDRGKPREWLDDRIDATWPEVHYSAWTVGLNRKTSAVAAHKAMLLVAPEQVVLLRDERALDLRWKLPAVVHAVAAGQVIVQRLDEGGRVVYAERGERLKEEDLDPAHEVRYRLFSRLPHGDSAAVEVAARPLPVLARVTAVEVHPGDRNTRVRWTMTGGAADEIVLLRSERPLSEADLKRADQLRIAGPIRLALSPDLRLAGSAPGQTALLPQADGSFVGEWIDATAQPGVVYYYAPLLHYRDDNRRWLDNQGVGLAFAEATLRAEPLPHGARLSWTLPQPGQPESVILERLDAAAPPLRLRPDQTSHVERNLPAGRACSYRLRICYTGALWDGSPLTVASTGVTAEVRPLGVGLDLPRRTPRPAAPAAWREGREVRWEPVEGVVLLAVPGQGRLDCRPATAGHLALDRLPAGEYEARVRHIDADGQASEAATVRVGGTSA